MITKSQIIDVIQAMPEDEFADVEPVIEEIILLEKLKKARLPQKRGEMLLEGEVDKLVEKGEVILH
jgi:hypothetical protein